MALFSVWSHAAVYAKSVDRDGHSSAVMGAKRGQAARPEPGKQPSRRWPHHLRFRSIKKKTCWATWRCEDGDDEERGGDEDDGGVLTTEWQTRNAPPPPPHPLTPLPNPPPHPHLLAPPPLHPIIIHPDVGLIHTAGLVSCHSGVLGCLHTGHRRQLQVCEGLLTDVYQKR